ncbi:hypothetical protein OPT61_g3640 [Boeremia exigua]|uniref:Uncharacterized protein n=1 Tax=Boeremia exigua TaxID=749465 RepID=A0ACC2IHC3_9PLEO|nr:hypothetical protein OPT61_g3640 [Boeremia exigua]
MMDGTAHPANPKQAYVAANSVYESVAQSEQDDRQSQIIACLCLSLDKQRVSKYGEDVKSITLLSPTIFPIVYAAILGKMLRRLALFKAERNATLGTIERLVGCQSLFSTFERQFAFRRMDLLGVSLLVAWLLSPLGGQSSLRLLSTQPLLVLVDDTVKYFPIEGYAKQTHLFNKGYAEMAWPLFAPLYMTALLTSRQYLTLPMDQFGNVKIPDLFQLKSYSSSLPADTWYEIEEGSTPEYISIMGIPMAGLPETGNTTFTLDSHYWSIECGSLSPFSEYVNATLDKTPSLSFVPKGSAPVGADNSTEFTYQTRWITSESNERLKNGTIVPVVSGVVSQAACRAFPVVVRSRIDCQGRSCAVKAMRRVERNTEEIFRSYESTTAWFTVIGANMPGADQGLNQKDSSSSELVEHWMMDPELSTFRWDRSKDRSGVEKRWVNVADLPTEVMSARLQVAMNTYWQSALGSTIMMGNLTKQRVEQLEDTGFDYTWNTTELVGARQDGEQYACHTCFAVITIVISFLLFAASVASLVLGLFTKAPDTLGYVSTSARDNPYITTQVPSHFDGLEAARALQHSPASAGALSLVTKLQMSLHTQKALQNGVSTMSCNIGDVVGALEVRSEVLGFEVQARSVHVKRRCGNRCLAELQPTIQGCPLSTYLSAASMATDGSRDDVSVLRDSLDASTLTPSNERSVSAASGRHRYEPVPVTETTREVPMHAKVSEEQTNYPQDVGLLTRSRFHWTVLMPLDVMLMLSPIFFFIIACLCISLEGRAKSGHGENVKAITLVAPSIFPILYAAVLGKMLRRVGLYRAEKSAKIGTVERLIGCQSVFTAIERQIALRRFDLLGLAILFAWLLSPIGGQTSLRMLNIEPLKKEFNNTVRYFPIEGFARQTLFFARGGADVFWPLWAPLYMTALQTSRHYWSSPMDMFGNVRIPDISQSNTSTIDPPDYDWHDFGDIADVRYTSMLGLPIVGIPDTGNSSFRFQSFYWSVNCSGWNSTDFTETEYNQKPTFNLTSDWRGGNERFDFIYWTKRVMSQDMEVSSSNPHANNTGILCSSRCSALPVVTESDVACQGRSCSVQGMRRLQRNPHKILSHYDGPIDFLNLIYRHMPGADVGYNKLPSTVSSVLVEQWIFNPDLSQFEWVLDPVDAQWEIEDRWVDLAQLSPETFSHHLQLAINTCWDASVGSMIRMGNFTLEQIEKTGTKYNFSWNKTELAGVSYDGERYVCNIAFATITMCLSLALCVAALTSLILGIVIKAPDILGYVSTSARDNPYVREHVSSRSDGLQAARALRDVEMRIGDVNGTGEVGHVAFTTNGQDLGKLSRKRMYD